MLTGSLFGIACFAGCDSKHELSKPQVSGEPNSASSPLNADSTSKLPVSPDTPKVLPNDSKAKALEPRSPVLEGPAETDPIRPEGDQSAAQANKKVYTKANLHKNNTVLLLTMEPDIRARAILNFLREDLTADEMESAVRFILEHDHVFQTMIQRRAAIQNEAVFGDDTMAKMRRLKIDIYETTNHLRLVAQQKYLTPERLAARQQRKREARAFEAKEALKTKEGNKAAQGKNKSG